MVSPYVKQVPLVICGHEQYLNVLRTGLRKPKLSENDLPKINTVHLINYKV